MDPDHAPIDDAAPPARHSLGRAIAAVPDPGPARSASDRSAVDRSAAERSPSERIERPLSERSDEGAPAWFTVVLRGYDRAQVDARLAELDRRIHDEIVRGDSAEAQLTTARAHVRRLQETAAPAAAEDRGFGVRVERVLQAAEREADELRGKAAQEAAELVEKARTDADRARRQTEEALLGRAAKLDDEFTARSAALDAREQEVDRIVERARREAEQIRGDAERAATETAAIAEHRAGDLLRQAERTIEQQRADATRDIGRMAALRDEVRHELSRLHGLLRGELGDDVVAPVPEETPAEEPWRPQPSERAEAPDEPTTSDDDAGATTTAIGTVPSYPTAAVGVLPFGDRSAGGPANGRSFAFGLVPDMRSGTGPDADRPDATDGPRTSDDTSMRDSDPGADPTRSTSPGQGRR